jgi:starvation-inducible DNA-binding protein
VALGGFVAGTLQTVAKTTKLDAYPMDVSDEKQHLKLLADRLSAYCKLAREAITAADESGDKDTADLFTGVSRSIDKHLWFIEAHLQ